MSKIPNFIISPPFNKYLGNSFPFSLLYITCIKYLALSFLFGLKWKYDKNIKDSVSNIEENNLFYRTK